MTDVRKNSTLFIPDQRNGVEIIPLEKIVRVGKYFRVTGDSEETKFYEVFSEVWSWQVYEKDYPRDQLIADLKAYYTTEIRV